MRALMEGSYDAASKSPDGVCVVQKRIGGRDRRCASTAVTPKGRCEWHGWMMGETKRPLCSEAHRWNLVDETDTECRRCGVDRITGVQA